MIAHGFIYLLLWGYGCFSCILFKHVLRRVYVDGRARNVCYRCQREGGWFDV